MEFDQGVFSRNHHKVDPLSDVCHLRKVLGPTPVDLQQRELLFHVLQDLFAHGVAQLGVAFRGTSSQQLQRRLAQQDVLTPPVDHPALLFDVPRVSRECPADF